MQVAVAAVDVVTPKPITVEGAPSRYSAGEEYTVGVSLKARKAERGEFVVSEDGLVLARALSVGGTAELTFRPRIARNTRIAVTYETIEEDDFSCGRVTLTSPTRPEHD